MMHRRTFVLCSIALAMLASLAWRSLPSHAQHAQPESAAATRPEPTTIRPVPRADQWWQERHAAVVERVRRGGVGVLFIGDSITQGWEGEGRAIWEKRFAQRNAVNLGFSGDRTQHVLWRLHNGEIEDIAPKLAVIMIGTNNSNGSDNTAAEIAEGIQAIIASLRAKLPETKILLLAIFPRGEKPNPQREKNATASEVASKAAEGHMVHYLDIGPKFLDAEGALSKEIMPDSLHLSAKGYEIWADAIEEKTKELMDAAVPAHP